LGRDRDGSTAARVVFAALVEHVCLARLCRRKGDLRAETAVSVSRAIVI
jgi:hypothetical protein